MEIEMSWILYSNLGDLPNLKEDWDSLRKQKKYYIPPYEDFIFIVTTKKLEFAVLVKENGKTKNFAVFFLRNSIKKFSISKSKLFEMNYKGAFLFGSEFVGSIKKQDVVEICQLLRNFTNCDLISVGEKEPGSEIYTQLQSVKSKLWVMKRDRKTSIHWLIQLPESYEEYLDGIKPSRRKALLYARRRLSRDFDVKIIRCHQEEGVESFLRNAEYISRKTYQWTVGHQMIADQDTVAEFKWKARENKLRCFLLFLNDEPCAFAHGFIDGDRFMYETPGFDRSYSKWSIGNILLLTLIEDLIKRDSCNIFDFGVGGDEVGYKSIFGNTSYPVEFLEIAKIPSVRGVLILSIQHFMNMLKNFMARAMLYFEYLKIRKMPKIW